jgi:prevent-host-death family protein
MWPQEVVAMKAQKTIGIRDFKEQLSGHIKEVKSGETLVITERGKPVARLMPIVADLDAKLQQMVDSGQASWSGQKPPSDGFRASVKGPKTVAELLLEDRE